MSTSSALRFKARCRFRNTWRLLRQQSRFKVAVVGGFAVLFELFLVALFYDGFRFISLLGGIGVLLVNRLFALFFLGMGVMLVLSGIVSAYAALFRSEEIPYLVTCPFSTADILTYKFAEATRLSSWAFLFVVIPFVTAFALHEKLSWLFAVWTAVFAVPYLFLCSGVGMILTLLITRWYPGGVFAKRLPLWLGLAAFAGLVVLSRGSVKVADDTRLSLSALVPGLRIAGNALLPSYWFSEGIMDLTQGRWSRGLPLLGVLASSAGVVGLGVEWLGTRTFYEAWQRATSNRGGSTRPALLLAWLRRPLGMLPADVRSMVLKDIRTFFRDPLQWSQALIFFGLLGLYFANIRSFHYQLLPDSWKTIVSFLNVFSVSAVICSLGSRFVYPQLSLEGQGFWIIGLAPTSIRRVVFTKLGMAMFGLVPISALLIFLSSEMLSVVPALRAVAVLLAGAVATAVCGLSTGLGAVHLDLRQKNPAAIVSGFGGTLNLVLSLGFLLVTIVPCGALFHLRNTGVIGVAYFSRAIWVVGAWVLVATAIAVWLPVAAGIRSMSRRDY